MLDRLEFLMGEALVALRRNTWMSFAAITTSAMALFLLGGLGFVYLSLAQFVNGLSQKVEMKVFLKDTVADKAAAALGDRFLKVPGVASVRFVPRDTGLKEFLAANPNIDIKGLEVDNPLPNAYEIRVQDLKVFDSVAKQIGAYREVEKDGVKYPAAEQDFLAATMKAVPWLGLTLGGLMLATSGILIYNAIRMTVIARTREIRIMQLVGATRFTVWAPMLLEGVVQGLMGGLLATFVLWSAYTIVQATVVRSMDAFGRLGAFPVQSAFLVLGIAGACYGLVCSIVAVREPLQFKQRAT
ncbi:MAG: hypothetical protein JSS66_13715 [Armatimonadetes bacterium]|nr:hypothetical protein [Armatimonadota bacterium]